MPQYVNFGDFRVQTDQLKFMQETVDIDGEPCVMLFYAKGACILLYDEAADAAKKWFGSKNMSTVAERLPTKTERERALMETTLDNIGRPDDLDRVDVIQLQTINVYRINVYRWIRDVSKITDSFYVLITADGPMSSPPMDKKYYDGDLAAMWGAD